MAKLEVTKQDGYNVLTFTMESKEVKTIRLTDEPYKAMQDYFKPKSIIESKEFPEFDVLWKIHAKGNKKTAKLRFIKAMKLISFDEIKLILESYVKSNDFVYLKGLDVWLNPEKEHWNDPIVKKEDKFKKEEPKKESFFR